MFAISDRTGNRLTIDGEPGWPRTGATRTLGITESSSGGGRERPLPQPAVGAWPWPLRARDRHLRGILAITQLDYLMRNRCPRPVSEVVQQIGSRELTGELSRLTGHDQAGEACPASLTSREPSLSLPIMPAFAATRLRRASSSQSGRACRPPAASPAVHERSRKTARGPIGKQLRCGERTPRTGPTGAGYRRSC